MRWRLTAVCVSAKKWRSVRETRSRHTNCSYMIKQHFSPHPLSQIYPLPIENISGKEDGNGLHWQRSGEEKFLSPMGCRRVLPPRLSTDAQANRNKMSRCISNRRHISNVKGKFWGLFYIWLIQTAFYWDQQSILSIYLFLCGSVFQPTLSWKCRMIKKQFVDIKILHLFQQQQPQHSGPDKKLFGISEQKTWMNSLVR